MQVKEDIDVKLNTCYEQLYHILVSNKIMNTLQEDGKIIGFSSHDHPHTPKQIAKLTKDNIEKMKKVLPPTPETVKRLENYIKMAHRTANLKKSKQIAIKN